MSRFSNNNNTHVVDGTFNSDRKDIEGHSGSDPAFTIHGDHPIIADGLAPKLPARQVQMIAIGGTIGTGLFLGTGKSLATGGPASMLIAYLIVGAIVLMTMLALGEMAAFVPIAGSFCTFAGRYVDDAFGFALTWNYWFNDAVSTAADLTALQLVFSYWDTAMPGWALSLIFWFVLILANIVTVRAYGEIEYWLCLLKVITITVCIWNFRDCSPADRSRYSLSLALSQMRVVTKI
jgi:AAT family amino acid transporter